MDKLAAVAGLTPPTVRLSPTFPGAPAPSGSAVVNPNFVNLEAVVIGSTLLGQSGVPAGDAGAPVFTLQPKSRKAAVGATVAFRAAATGSRYYPWQKNAVPIPGATAATLTLEKVTRADAGSYSVIAANAAGSVVSAPADLSVSPLLPGAGVHPAALR